MSRIIKRYENRKLYDAEARKFMSLHEIAELIRGGVDVKIIDKKSGEDITTQSLTQVSFEEGKRGRNPFSTEILHDVIRWQVRILDDTVQQVRDKISSLVPKPDSGAKTSDANNDSGPEEVKNLTDRVNALEKMITDLANLKSNDNSK
ncbi:MAG: hypothetical protein JRH15_13985 [Deltaproteobacteria bacterium]|nr:hypothetical protein [Deltaproteobacteria bacterium]